MVCVFQDLEENNSCNGATAYYGLGTDPRLFETAPRALAEGNALRATARIVEGDKERVGGCLDRATRQCRAVMLSLWRDLPATECQLDERWGFVRSQQENWPGAHHHLDSHGNPWARLAFAPVWRWVLEFVASKRDQASANRLLGQIAQVSDARILPLFTSDRWPAYSRALWQRGSPIAFGQPTNSCRIGYRPFTGKSISSSKSCSPVGPRFITEVKGHYPGLFAHAVQSLTFSGLKSVWVSYTSTPSRRLRVLTTQ